MSRDKRDAEIFAKVMKGTMGRTPSKDEKVAEAKRVVAKREAEQREAKRRKDQGRRGDDGVIDTGMFR